MPGVERHLRDGKLIGVMAAIAAAALLYYRYRSLVLAAIAAPVVFVLTVAGAMFPDVDVNSSKPYRWSVRLGTGAGAIAVGYALFTNWQRYLAVLAAWFGGLLPAGVPLPAVGVTAAGAAVLAIRFGVAKGIDGVTGSHRGWTHDPLTLSVLALVVAGVLWYWLPGIDPLGFRLRPVIAVGVPTALFLGSLTHIGRDLIS